MKKIILSASVLVMVASAVVLNKPTAVLCTEEKHEQLVEVPSIVSTPVVIAAETIAKVYNKGDKIALVNGYVGTVNLIQEAVGGVLRVAGELDNGGTFCIAIDNATTTSGLIVSHKECYELPPTVSGASWLWVKKTKGEVVCSEMPEAEGAVAVAGTSAITAQANVPVLNSRLGAKVVLLLDFTGGSLQDPLWAGGKLTTVKPADYTLESIKTAYGVVAERYSAFSVNVTTDPGVYKSAPAKKRMRVLFTTSSEIMPGYAGYAYINSLTRAGDGVYSSTIPCFAFTSSVGSAKNAGEVAAHEAGHTFGLRHDGVSGKSDYYAGQGNWAPIMGIAYTKTIAQWSKGEYNLANNSEDDISTIAAVVGGGTISAGFVSVSNAVNPTILTGSLSVSDTVSNENTSRYFSVSVAKAGNLTVNASVPVYGALNILVEILNDRGVVMVKNNDIKSLNSTVTVGVGVGKYLVRVSGEGELDPKVTGYSKYGSIGSFNINCTVR